MNGKIVTA